MALIDPKTGQKIGETDNLYCYGVSLAHLPAERFEARMQRKTTRTLRYLRMMHRRAQAVCR
jgi:hypothetical protein